ncbi:serine carboxypeptidase-like 7 [Corylus avellana]|uniref:serine carboxypeptidase-like 7 n=1 Tax=Corylus avellana TaxID=13451 RepID=UPI00286BC779|nr:serine carboxypeptidase-like 7 [Corylus avellana]
MASKASSSVCLHFLLLLLVSGTAISQSVVKTLPGYPGELPFTLETGYVSVGNVEFFYYFVESEGKPGADPLLLYMNGGPGCSGLNGFFYQIGPLKFNISDYTGGLPTLIYEPNTWTKTANIIFIDIPVGAGFSYATTTDAWGTTDTEWAAQAYEFLRNWLGVHPDFVTNPVFLGSDSYAGIITPILAQDIINGNEAGITPRVNLKGYSIGCPHTNTDLETNAKVTFAHRMALISDAMYKSAKTSCHGNYADPTTANCTEALSAISQCIELISSQNILEPDCAFLSPKAKEERARRSLRDNSQNFILPSPRRTGEFWCKNFDYLLMDIWGNYRSVQDALHVRPGTIKQFFRCNITLDYTVVTNDVVPYHKNLTDTGLQILVFSGDHDMVIPHNGIERWINSLDLTLDTDWRPWFVSGQVAGYTRKYTNDGYRLTYATLKGSGHSPPEYKRKECYNMFHRWVYYYPL